MRWTLVLSALSCGACSQSSSSTAARQRAAATTTGRGEGEMGYNPVPDWTEDIEYPAPHIYKCPVCGHVPNPKHVDEILDNLYNVGYYYPRHIPPKLVFTCDNEDCPHCDEDFEYALSVTISAVLILLPDDDRMGRG